MANISHYAASNDVDCSYTIAIAKTVTFVGGLILAKGDQFWLPKSVRPDLFWQQKWSGGTSFSAKIGPAGPILGGTDFGVTVPTTSVDTQQSTTFVTTSNPPGDQQTLTTQSAVSINTEQDSSLHPQHLANLLLLAASQLSTTPINSSLVQHQHPTVMADPPTTTPPQDDRLSEASGISPPNVPAVIPPSMPPNTVIPPTTSTHITPDPVSSLPGSSLLAPWTQPPVPAHLRECILAGEFIDFNNLLTGAMFSTHDSPSRQPTAHSLTLQMSPQGGGFEIAPAHNTTRKINSFSLWMEAWNVYACTLFQPTHHVHWSCLAINA